jgi:hypothetical protein
VAIVDTLQLAEFRWPWVPFPFKESFEVIWRKDGKELEKFRDNLVLEINDSEVPSEGEPAVRYSVDIRLITEEVRRDDGLVFRDRFSFPGPPRKCKLQYEHQ